jgi:hypothetical protein
MVKLVYDPKGTTVSYGFFVCPDCKASFYGGGRTMHSDGCPRLPNTLDYSGLELHFNDLQVQKAKEAAVYFDDETHDWYGVSVAKLKQHFPELLADA